MQDRLRLEIVKVFGTCVCVRIINQPKRIRRGWGVIMQADGYSVQSEMELGVCDGDLYIHGRSTEINARCCAFDSPKDADAWIAGITKCVEKINADLKSRKKLPWMTDDEPEPVAGEPDVVVREVG